MVPRTAKRKKWNRMHVQGVKPSGVKSVVVGRIDLNATAVSKAPVWLDKEPARVPSVPSNDALVSFDMPSVPCPNCAETTIPQCDGRRGHGYCQRCGYDWRIELGRGNDNGKG